MGPLLRPVLPGLLLALLLVAGGCGAGADRTLTVLAAASLADAFPELAETFEAEHPSVDVRFSFASSTDLAGQAADGAPGGVLATADDRAMRLAEDAGVVTDPAAFARNTMVIATPRGNPAGVESLADLAGVDWVRCADPVPCGRVATALVAEADVGRPISLEEDARSTLEKVVAGEVDAGLVYATDAASAGAAVEVVVPAGAEEVATTYLLDTLAQAEEPALAEEWVRLVLSDDGRRVLREHGFGLP